MSTEPLPQARASDPVLAGLLREPALPLLMVALAVMFYRGYLPDILLVAATAAVVSVDAYRWRLRSAPATPVAPPRHRALWSLGLAGPAVAIAVLPRVSRQVDTAFVLVGALALALAWLPGQVAPPSNERDPAPPARWWLWPLLGVAIALVELYSLLYQPAVLVDSPDHPSISTVVEPALNTWPARACGLYLWLLAGWWLVRRVRAWAG